MKKLTFIFLLGAGMLLSLAGCQEKPVTPDGNKDGALVEFAAVAGNPATRTSYSGQGTTDASGNLIWERIDWLKNDQVLIWSDKATSKAGTGKSSVYSILDVKEVGTESHATLSDPNGTGLHYAAEGGDHTFWGLYPANAVSTTPTADNLSFSIPGEQTGTKEDAAGNITLKPDMDLAVMLAVVEDAKPNKKVDIRFYPAFTAFEFTFMVDDAYVGDAVLLHHVTLTSSSDLVGTVSASIKTGTREIVANSTDNYAFITNGKKYTAGASEYGFSNTKKTVKFDLDGGVMLEKGKELKMTIVTLPQNIEDLTIGMYMGENGDDVRTGTLKIGSGDNKKNLAFAACQKHCIRGVLLKPNDWEFSLITTILEVLDWEPVDITGESGNYPQAYQFSVSGTGVLNGYSDIHHSTGDKDPWRQQWYFKPGQTVTVFFKVALPAGGSWEVEPVLGTEASPVVDEDGNPIPASTYFQIKNVSPALDEQHPTVATDLWGNMHESGTTNIKLEITYIGTDTNEHSMFFHTYVYSGPNKTGTKFNIDSETQLYDRGRGYHTFFVNSPLYPNN